jgi:hypothetical protein
MRFESEATIVANTFRESVVEPLQAEIAKLREYIELLENQVISMMAEDPIPFLPVDPEEQRRLGAKASDGTQCMIYRGHS